MEENKVKSVTYRDAGVDIDAGDSLARWIGKRARETRRVEVVGGIGSFAGLCALPSGMRDPLLVAGTDGVGTKLEVALAAARHDGVGIDLVAMCVNDVITCGAEPLFFLDYYATGKLDGDVARAVLGGIVDGCKQAGCALLGGETAEMPGMYGGGSYDLAGFTVGVVERDAIIDGARIAAGDAVIGLPSSGLHSNGFSLARRVLFGESGKASADALGERVDALAGRTVGEALLEPTIIYVAAARALRQAADVRGLVHITGGGLIDNPPRCLPDGLAYALDRSSWDVPAICRLVGERGNVAEREMLRTFNMGIGMLAVVPREDVDAALAAAGEAHGARVVGEIVARAEGGDAVQFR
ncbi:MAG: phosphoribosylformylglycinamidine cyclo-ligase [Myxococcales bacterium]|nr:phosphoribosylformylglycinamidine cyclo-ligase [Myxococcales bacterium]